ncbi:alpha/beta hydrolase family protein [uncultured Chryseobacterium sp.]|uniref:alpha/beta hydrolase n=1 Tax=uncultured Chryseobacterium sp. TaxID=259322 RepID=UPI0025F081EC|nr:alpha/beta hydrolase family protein [uncultured Chryseobacterium sp.]
MNIGKNKTGKLIRFFSIVSLIAMGLTIFSSCSKDDENDSDEQKAPVVLVHGAWQASYAWESLKNKLLNDGFQVTVVNLKGHGNDSTPVSQLSFEGYVNQVKNAINAFNEPVILIGHSLGGAIITQTAAAMPEKVSKLVYVAGFIPQMGKSVLDYAAMDSGSLLGPVLEFNADHTLAGVADHNINFPKIFIQDGTEAQKQFVLDHYKAEPVVPLATPLNYTIENYNAAGKKYYVFTLDDNAISYSFQQQMAIGVGITKTFTIASGHSPFISKADELTAIIKNISKD